MQNYLTDIRDFISDRISSPFWLSTILSWFFWNWQVTITMIFQPGDFSADYFRTYLDSTNSAYHLGLPIISGITYSTLSGSIRETLELLSKAARSLVIKLDRSGRLYKSISLSEHNNKIERLNREINRVYLNIEDTEALKSKNDSLLNEIEQIKSTERDIADLIMSETIQKNMDDSLKKLRFIRALHDRGFALGISEDDIPSKREADEEQAHREGITNKSNDVNERDHFTTMKASDIPEYDSEYNAMQKSMSRNLLNELKNTKSLTSILATLLLVKSKNQIDTDLSPSLLGLSDEKFKESIENLSSANLITKNSKSLSLTSAGARRITKLQDDLDGHEFTDLLKKTKTLAQSTIKKHLYNNSLTRQDIYQNSIFHPYLPEIVSEMIKSGEISEEGQFLFLNKTLPPKTIKSDPL